MTDKPARKKSKQRTRTPMPEQDPQKRVDNFDEVPFG